MLYLTRLLRSLIVVILGLWLTACGTATVKMKLVASSRLNQDAQGASLPVFIRVYTLNSPEDFTDASFATLWHQDKAALANSLISRQELSINPHSMVQLKIPLTTETHYFAVLALFRHPYAGKWRVWGKLPSRFAAPLTEIQLKLQGRKLSRS